MGNHSRHHVHRHRRFFFFPSRPIPSIRPPQSSTPLPSVEAWKPVHTRLVCHDCRPLADVSRIPSVTRAAAGRGSRRHCCVRQQLHYSGHGVHGEYFQASQVRLCTHVTCQGRETFATLFGGEKGGERGGNLDRPCDGGHAKCCPPAVLMCLRP